MNVWQVWHNTASEYKTRRVVGFVPGYGIFEMRQGVIYRLFGGTPKELGTCRRATPDELAEIDWAAVHGCLQIEIRPVTGVFYGQCGYGCASGREPTRIVWQARGIA